MKTILYILGLISAVSAGCQRSEKGWSPSRSTCSDITSSNIQQELSNSSISASYFTFEKSVIEKLPTNVFVPLQKGNILYLYMNSCRIGTIQTGAFAGLLEVREIYLQSNSLDVISRGTFNSIVKLRILDLSKNNLYLIEDDAFNGSNDLRKIFLNDNGITYLPRFLFHPLKQIQYVNLTNNKMKTFDLTFSNVAIIKTISLNDNQINNISCETVRDSSLNIVELKNNLLTEVDGTCLPVIAEEIILKNNLIMQINNLTLLKSLKYLDLSDNAVSNLSPDDFKGLKKLTFLKLNRNNLSKLAPGNFKDLRSLELLNLSENSIRLLDYGVFNGLDNLNNLDLSHNELEVLEEEVFHNLISLKVLNVSYNNLQYVNLVKLRSYTSSFQEIDLIGNNISCQKLSAMFSYRLNVKIAHNVYHDISNVNGIPCNNINAFVKNNEIKLASNIFREMKSFLDTDFKNTSFFKFFSPNQTNDASQSNATEISESIVNLQMFLKEEDTVLHQEFEMLSSQTSQNRVIFIIFTLVISLICVLLLIAIMLLRNFLKRVSFVKETEMCLL